MLGAVLLTCGLVATALGTWRGYVVAREAVGPFVHAGDETRTLVERAQPPGERARLRLFARRVAVSTGWLAFAMFGLLLLAEATR